MSSSAGLPISLDYRSGKPTAGRSNRSDPDSDTSPRQLPPIAERIAWRRSPRLESRFRRRRAARLTCRFPRQSLLGSSFGAPFFDRLGGGLSRLGSVQLLVCPLLADLPITIHLLLKLAACVDLLAGHGGLLWRQISGLGLATDGGSKDRVRSMARIWVRGTGTAWFGTLHEPFADRSAAHGNRMSQMVSEIGGGSRQGGGLWGHDPSYGI